MTNIKVKPQSGYETENIEEIRENRAKKSYA